MRDSAEFYQRIAADYDQMTRFDERLAARQEVLKRWVDHYRVNSVLDIACGTGINAIALTRLGLRVTGTDISLDMLAQAESNARRWAASVEWLPATMLEIIENVGHRTFDAALCLGNSIPHLAGPAELAQFMENVYRLLEPGGVCIVELLNYNRVLAHQERIVNVTRGEDVTYVRFYDFLDPGLRFNLLIIIDKDTSPQWRIESTRLYPFRVEEVRQAAEKCGLTDIRWYGGLDFAPFDLETSGNIVMAARKQSAGSGIKT
jgi:ubiquinone/menaquinone biosynthesis C-methylase UbiE